MDTNIKATNGFHEMLVARHSIRKYTAQELDPNHVKLILEAALLAPTSKNGRSWQFTVVDDKEQLALLSQCKPQFATPIARCAMAIVVSANPEKSDAWIEDASVAATYIQLQAESLGLGSCWIQVRGRDHDSETTASEHVKAQFQLDPAEQVLCVIAIGHKDEVRKPANLDKLQWEKVHVGTWNEVE